MIFSFSVPEDNPRFKVLIDWYLSYNESKSKRMERSRDFREMFIGLLVGNVGVEKETVRKPAPVVIADLQPINVVPKQEEVDLESRLDNLTF